MSRSLDSAPAEVTVGPRSDGEPEPPPAGSAGRRSWEWAQRRWVQYRPQRNTAWPLTIILIATLAVWSYPALAHFATSRLSVRGDAESFSFYMSWNLHALTHLQNPFFSPNLYAPFGQDLSNGITMPVVGLLMSPVTAIWGGTAAYNCALLLAVFMAGAAVFLLARELTGSPFAATVVGCLMLVSPYLTGHGMGHLNLMWIFGLPYLTYLAVRLTRGTISRPLAFGGIALTFLLTAGASTELAVTQTFFAGIALIIALLLSPGELRRRVVAACRPMLSGLALGALLASPIFYAALSHGTPAVPRAWITTYSTDLTNLFTANGVVFVGVIRSITKHYFSNSAENTAFVPWMMLAFVLIYPLFRRTRLVTGLMLFALLSLVLSFGPHLPIAGRRTIWMPWSLFMNVPGLGSALPNRFTAFMFIALLLVLADALSRVGQLRRLTMTVVVVSAVFLVPNLLGLAIPARTELASFVSSGDLQREIRPGEDILVLPGGQNGPGMRWLAATDFYFDTVTGNGGGASPPPQLSDPVARAIFRKNLTFDFKTSLRPYLERTGVHTVLVPADAPDWKTVADGAFGDTGKLIDDVWIYRF